MISAQGGDPSFLSMDRIDELCEVKEIRPIYSEAEGYIASIDTEKIGSAAQMLGAGRAKKDDRIDPAVGLVMKKRLGEYVRRDEPLCMMYINNPEKAEAAVIEFLEAFTFSNEKPPVEPVVYDIIGE